MTRPPDTYLGTEVPGDIKKQWHHWPGAQYRATNRLYPPDERFNVRAPEGMCPFHWGQRIGYRNMHFDPVTGNRWPGYHGSPFIVIGEDLNAVREARRCEWDEESSEQMRLIERICLSGRSPQCNRQPADADAAR